MKKAFCLYAFCILASIAFAQHQPIYSQYMFSGLTWNPANTGDREALSIQLLHRQQWWGFDGAPASNSILLHTPLKNPTNNFGAIISTDRFGVSQRNQVMGTYAFRFPAGKGHVSLGLQGGILLARDRWTDINPTDPDDAVFREDSPMFTIPLAGFGISYKLPKFYIGFSAPYLIEYQNSVYQEYLENALVYRPFLMATGLTLKLNPNLSLRPGIMLRYIQNSPLELDINSTLLYKEKWSFGVNWRTGDAVVGLIKFQISPQFALGYAYDQNINALAAYNKGSHELMLRYEFRYSLISKSSRTF